MKLTQPVKGELKYAPDGIISQKFNDPTTPPDLLIFYKSIGLDGHNGIDFYGERETDIYAAHSGKVVYAQDTGGTAGKMIKLQGEGFYTLYMHNDELLVSVGENVSTGQIIAKMGNSGSGRGLYMSVHCHFGLYPEPLTINGFGGAVDPLPCFTNMRYVILGKEQYLLDDNLKIALNIGDEIELAKLQLHGLSGTPETITSLTGYLIYPLVDKLRLKDIFGL